VNTVLAFDNKAENVDIKAIYPALERVA